MSDLERCVAFIRSFDERRARRVVPSRFGKALFDEELPRDYLGPFSTKRAATPRSSNHSTIFSCGGLSVP